MDRKGGRETGEAANVSGDNGTYHHGDLRRELLRVARDQIALNGASTVTLSSLARLVGVSQAAPYRHFADRDALLSGVAETGFEEFNMALAESVAMLPPPAALRAISLAYVQYGERNIELYRLMFASRLVPGAKVESGLATAADAAFNHLRCVMQGIAPARAAERRAMLTWAQLHGLVMLKADGFVTAVLTRLLDSPD